jgi:hypothetical protein
VVRTVEFVSGRLSYILQGRWCNIITLNVHAPCEVKGNDVKDSSMKTRMCYLINFVSMI